MCAQSRMHYGIETTTSVTPLIVVTIYRTASALLPVAVCRLCIADLGNRRARAMSRVAKWGVAVFLACVIVPWFIQPVISVLAGGAVVMVGIFAYLAVRDEWIKKIVPCCPACGTIIVRQLNARFAQNPGPDGVPNYIICTECGYQGPRVPLEGLWKFVDYRGPRPLDGTFLQKPARHSWNVRHAQGKKWWKFF